MTRGLVGWWQLEYHYTTSGCTRSITMVLEWGVCTVHAYGSGAGCVVVDFWGVYILSDKRVAFPGPVLDNPIS